MNTLAQDSIKPILDAESEACAMFYDHVGLGDEGRAASSVAAYKHVVAEFTRRGYEIYRLPQPINGSYQMLLLHNGVEVACIPIRIDVIVGEMKVYEKL